MPRPLPQLAIVTLLALLSSMPAYAQLGFGFGANFDHFGDIEGNREATLDNATGYHVGVFYDLGLGPLGLRPGVYYVDVGEATVEFAEDFCSLDDGCNNVLDLTLIEVPIDIRVRAMTPIIKPYAVAGPVLRFADSDNEDIRESLNEFTVAGNIGAGLELNVPGFGLRVMPEIRYAFGVQSMVDDFEFLGSDFTAEGNDQRLNTWIVRLGVSF